MKHEHYVYQHLPLRTERTRLTNGLQIITANYRLRRELLCDDDIVTIMIRFDCGSVDDIDRPGGAHFLEHMLFEGPSRDGVHPKLRHLYQRGIEVDGCTGRRDTQYSITGWRDDLNKLFLGLVSMCFEYDCNDNDLDLERGVIIQEMRERDPEEDFMLWCDQVRFPRHGHLHYMVDGTEESVSGITSVWLKKIHNAYYAPPHASVIVVGDIEHNEIVDMVASNPLLKEDEKDEEWQKVESVAPWKESVHPERLWTEHHTDKIRSRILFTFPRQDDVKDHSEMIFADLLLGHFPFGLFTREVRVRHRIAYGVQIRATPLPRLATEIEVKTDPEHFDLVSEMLVAAVERLCRGDIAAETWDTIRNGYRVGSMLGVDCTTSTCWAEWLADGLLSNDLKDRNVNAQIRALTPQQVAQAVLPWFHPKSFGTIQVYGY